MKGKNKIWLIGGVVFLLVGLSAIAIVFVDEGDNTADLYQHILDGKNIEAASLLTYRTDPTALTPDRERAVETWAERVDKLRDQGIYIESVSDIRVIKEDDGCFTKEVIGNIRASSKNHIFTQKIHNCKGITEFPSLQPRLWLDDLIIYDQDQRLIYSEFSSNID